MSYSGMCMDEVCKLLRMGLAQGRDMQAPHAARGDVGCILRLRTVLHFGRSRVLAAAVAACEAGVGDACRARGSPRASLRGGDDDGAAESQELADADLGVPCSVRRTQPSRPLHM